MQQPAFRGAGADGAVMTFNEGMQIDTSNTSTQGVAAAAVAASPSAAVSAGC